MSQIPEIEFKNDNVKIDGFEIIDIAKIQANANRLVNSPEKPHQPNFFTLILYTKGESKHLVDFNWYDVKKNSLVYITKKQINAFSFNSKLKGYCILFSQEYFERCFGHIDGSVIHRLFTPELYEPIIQLPESSDIIDYVSLLYNEYYSEFSLRKPIIIESLFTIILSKAEDFRNKNSKINTDASNNPIVPKFLNLLESHYNESRDAVFYADKLSITYKHLNTTCKKYIDKTAKQVIDDYVILEAKRRLIDPNIQSTELSYLLGFDDPTNFTKYFRNKTGLTPNQFKRNHLSE